MSTIFGLIIAACIFLWFARIMDKKILPKLFDALEEKLMEGASKKKVFVGLSYPVHLMPRVKDGVCQNCLPKKGIDYARQCARVQELRKNLKLIEKYN